MPLTEYPKTMKAVQVKQFASSSLENVDEVMFMDTVATCQPTKNEILVQVVACSISPGDTTMVRGNLVFLYQPFPFIPGMDICGRVVDPNGSARFKVGDIIVAANGLSATGGMAEFMAVDEKEAILKPANVDSIEGASSSSAITARNAVVDHVKPGDRVLILGGSGGVGLPAIQFAKHHAKASFVAATSTQKDLCKSAGADVVLNYRETNWWEHAWGKRFDKIVDTVGGDNFKGKATLILKSNQQGGEFVAVTGDDPKPDVSTWWKVLSFFCGMMKRPLLTRMFPRRQPKYTLLTPYEYPEVRHEVLGLMANGTLNVVIDKACPLPFTEEGVREAFSIVASGHAHGKVVVSMESQKMESQEVLL